MTTKEQVKEMILLGNSGAEIITKLKVPRGTVYSTIHQLRKEGVIPQGTVRAKPTPKPTITKVAIKETKKDSGFVIIIGKDSSMLNDILDRISL